MSGNHVLHHRLSYQRYEPPLEESIILMIITVNVYRP